MKVRSGIGTDIGDSGSYAYGYCAKEDIGVIDITTPITGTWVDLNVVALLPNVGAVGGGQTYLGNGIFRNDSGADLTRNFFITMTAIQSGGTTPGTNNSQELAIGKFDGVNYVADISSITAAFTTKIGASAQEDDATFQLKCENISIPKDSQYRPMYRRNAGSRSHYTLAFSLAVL